MLQKNVLSSFELSIHQRILKDHGLHKNIKQHNFFNIYHNRICFLSIKSEYYNFWRSRDTKDWSNDAENSAWITRINYILKYIHTENSYFKMHLYFTIVLF